jgi:hypothetical protein
MAAAWPTTKPNHPNHQLGRITISPTTLHVILPVLWQKGLGIHAGIPDGHLGKTVKADLAMMFSFFHE